MLTHPIEYIRAKKKGIKPKGQVKKIPPFHDIMVEVCHIPNVLCVDIVLPLALDLAPRERREVFETPAVKGLVSYLWWHAAHAFESQKRLLAFFSLCILSLAVSNCARANTEDGHTQGWLQRSKFGAPLIPLEITNEGIWIGSMEFS